MGEKTNAEIQQEAQVWRAEVDGGPGMPIYVADESDPDLPYFRAWGDGWMGYVAADTPRAAAAKVAAHARGLPVVSILAPGQRPRTELERELDHLRAAVRALAGLGDGALDAVTPDAMRAVLKRRGWSHTGDAPWYADQSKTAFEEWDHPTARNVGGRARWLRDALVPVLPDAVDKGIRVIEWAETVATRHGDVAPAEVLAEALMEPARGPDSSAGTVTHMTNGKG